MLNAAAVRRVLSLDALDWFHFQCGSTPVYSAGYGRVAEAIRSRRIHVRTMPATGTASACYAPTRLGGGRYRANTFYFKPHVGDVRPEHIALIIHEATHALQDGEGRSGNRIEKEIAAFTAQALYWVTQDLVWLDYAREHRAQHGLPLVKDEDPMMETAHAIAARLYRGEGPSHVTEDEQRQMYGAIVRIPSYSRNASDELVFDGF